MIVLPRAARPITPAEAADTPRPDIPAEVYAAFNELIVKNLRGGEARFTLKEAAALAAFKLGLDSTSSLFANKWMDVEDEYRRAGWKVEYDQPGYNESYAATFTFSKRKAR